MQTGRSQNLHTLFYHKGLTLLLLNLLWQWQHIIISHISRTAYFEVNTSRGRRGNIAPYRPRLTGSQRQIIVGPVCRTYQIVVSVFCHQSQEEGNLGRGIADGQFIVLSVKF